ncbi:SDR family oxidoreductase [Oxynema aestuarii]|jgi:dTDP-4-dehydrorhamnose reductase|uniref:NAD(P)-dependent oxidoreductase n=1 Tax=Oxynema aestuarii AP17 TaxID=2064643 RepID=A0A6H1TWH4_9CYAN|nr:NAD(P)-dependent oxidoreductase [Oxynema aestuarii]QIZ70290.1 NAD(P)-dependent oxidoreductase [Oxynema aestuarii AP17]RMH73433.1 MAG: NAD(P)-dependent oxidoreductase [Cyanobacteria bacterium J007]
MKRLLLTGASGFLGWNLAQVTTKTWEVFGTYFCHSPSVKGIESFQIDLRDFQAVKDLFNTVRPEAVIHTAASSQPNFCELHPKESHEINVSATCNLAGLCADRGIPFVFTSTDLVFNGLNPPYRELDPVCPVSMYGEQKVMAELGVLERYPEAVVCRMPLMFGEAGPTATSFLQPMLAKLRSGERLRLFVDEFRTPVSGKTAALGLLLALEKGRGLLHLGGRESLSRYEFFELAIDVFELNDAAIAPCFQKDVKMAAPRPPDVSLDSSKAVALGYQRPTIREELEQLRFKV